ncbi:hypothetical protein [Paenibacillus xylaniclasticus]|uniref:hypothetical protein n=1 Tax=Paenibacillus xylaniclasticus TaxID=588083 RepID=UPI000FD722FA|nr:MULTISPECIES: hypothetical protein [Paenibacillus]GFN31866.1 hypothetical protein PCURB6_21260 [Paenibacillus curdlanolyticus]
MNMAPWGYVVLLGAFIVVFGLTRPRPKQDEPSAKSTMNMEIALEQFMENMESDNRELVELVKQSQEDNARQLALREKRIADLESRCADLEIKLQQSLVQAASGVNVPVVPQPETAPASAADEQHGTAAVEPELNRPSIRSRYPELFELYDQGKSIEAVARKIGKNKGEVQLIIQLAKQEEGAHA